MARRSAPLALLLAMLVGLAYAKTELDFGLGPRAHDADYYYTIAREVAAGRGLRTNLSLYFQGFQSFPHRVTTSPTWPLLLGGVGRLVRLPVAAKTLPPALYFADLVLLYFLALRLHRRLVPDDSGWLFRRGRALNFGHVAVAAFGTNAIFFRFSSVPNNEPLAFCLLFGALLALDRAVEARSAAWAAATGILAGLATLTRVQMLGLPIALLMALGGLALHDRSGRRLLAAAALGCFAPFLPWIAYLATWADPLRPQYILGLDVQRETPGLREFSHTRSFASPWAYLLDRLSGFLVAFHPNHGRAYTGQFGALPYAVLLALVPLAVSAPRQLRALRGGLERRHVLPATVILAGIGMLIPVHLAHMSFSSLEWVFGFRHGFPLLLLILPALAYLDAHRFRPLAVAVAVLLLATVDMNHAKMSRVLDKRWGTGIRPLHAHLVKWLDAQRPRPSVITTLPWELGTFSRSGYHWILCKHEPEDTLALLRQAKADYVVVFAKERICPFILGLPRTQLSLVKEFADGEILVYSLRGRAPRSRRAGESP